MNRRWAAAAAAAALGCWCRVGAAGGEVETTVGIVDMERVLSAHPETQEAERLLQKQIQEFETEKDTLLDKFERLKKDFEQARDEAESKALSEAGRQKKKTEAEEKLIALREFDAEVRQTTLLRQKQLADRKRRMRERIVERIRAIIQTYAAKKGLALVLDSGPMLEGPGAVVYSLKTMDITEDILKIVAADKVEREANAAPAAPAAAAGAGRAAGE